MQIKCPYCGSQLSTDGAYRVHKHRFHSDREFREKIVVPVQASAAPIVQPACQAPAAQTAPQESPAQEIKRCIDALSYTDPNFWQKYSWIVDRTEYLTRNMGFGDYVKVLLVVNGLLATKLAEKKLMEKHGNNRFYGST